MLADGQHDGAREELHRMLRAQSHDAESQDLLAKMYFRLGVYPRAIELYQDIIRQFPERLPTRINLALAYLKTGQMRDAVDQLLPVIEHAPDHRRAWGYLGLAWARLGEHAKAREAFARAGQEGMVRRMQQILEERYDSPTRSVAAVADLRPSLLPAADDAGDEAAEEPSRVAVPAAGPAWTAAVTAVELPEAVEDDALTVPPLRATEAGTLELRDGVLLAGAGCAVRLGPRTVQVGPGQALAVERKGAQGWFSGGPPLVWLTSGWVAVPPERERVRRAIDLRGEALVVCEPWLLAFESGLEYENTRVAAGEHALELVALWGHGRVVVQTAGQSSAIPCRAAAGVVVPVEMLVGWSGALSLQPSERSGCVSVQGDGRVYVAFDGREPDRGEAR